MMKSALVLGGLVLALVVPNYAIVQKERVLASGTPMLLALAPVDPRSLMAGDYMRLDYAITRTIADDKNNWPRDGHIVVILDSVGVAQLVRRYQPGALLSPGRALAAVSPPRRQVSCRYGCLPLPGRVGESLSGRAIRRAPCGRRGSERARGTARFGAGRIALIGMRGHDV